MLPFPTDPKAFSRNQGALWCCAQEIPNLKIPQKSSNSNFPTISIESPSFRPTKPPVTSLQLLNLSLHLDDCWKTCPLQACQHLQQNDGTSVVHYKKKSKIGIGNSRNKYLIVLSFMYLDVTCIYKYPVYHIL